MQFLEETPDATWTETSELKLEDLNAFEIGAAVGAAGIAVASLGITTMAAPTMVAVPGAVAGGFYLAGYNQRHGHLPFMGERGTTPAPVAAPQPGAVVDAAGKPVDVAGL